MSAPQLCPYHTTRRARENSSFDREPSELGTRGCNPGPVSASAVRLELVVHTQRYRLGSAAAPSRIARAGVVDDRRGGAIVAVGLDAMAAGAQIVVRIAAVDG